MSPVTNHEYYTPIGKSTMANTATRDTKQISTKLETIPKHYKSIFGRKFGELKNYLEKILRFRFLLGQRRLSSERFFTSAHPRAGNKKTGFIFFYYFIYSLLFPYFIFVKFLHIVPFAALLFCVVCVSLYAILGYLSTVKV